MKKLFLLNILILSVVALSAQNLGINTATPMEDIHLKQSTSTASGTGGIRFEESAAAGDYWKIYHSGQHISFAELGTRRAYVEAGTGNYVQPSDARLKEDVEALGDVLDNVLKLKPALYHYKSASMKTTKTLGFLAQEVKTLFPDFVYTGEDGKYGLAYKDFGILAVKAIQEQQEIINDLSETVKALTARIEELEKK